MALSIGEKERTYLDSVYSLHRAVTTEQKIEVLQRRSRYRYDSCSTIADRLQALELATISDEAPPQD